MNEERRRYFDGLLNLANVVISDMLNKGKNELIVVSGDERKGYDFLSLLSLTAFEMERRDEYIFHNRRILDILSSARVVKRKERIVNGEYVANIDVAFYSLNDPDITRKTVAETLLPYSR